MNKKGGDGLERLKADIKAGSPSNAYIICGCESYLKDYYISSLRKLILDGPMSDFNYKTLDGESFDANEFASAVETMPSFSERTLIEVRDLNIFALDEDDTAAFIDVISELPEWCCVVFIFDALEYKTDGRRKKLAAAVEANIITVEINEQSRSDLMKWIISHFKAHGKKISAEDCEYLIFLCGPLMSGLNSEIEKIATWCEGDSVSRADIDAVAVPVLEAAVFDLTDALSERKFGKAADVLNTLVMLQNEPLQILGAISTNFRRMYALKILKRNGSDAALMKKTIKTNSDFYMNKLLSAANGFGEKRLARAVELCAKADFDMKTSSAGNSEPLTELLISLCANG